MASKIKSFLVRTPLYKTLLDLRAWNISRKWVPENEKILNHQTVYCISPYKTATTFIAGCFDENISKHEPWHYTSVKKLNQDFDKYFVRRLNSLNLKLECSGFLFAFVDKLAENQITKDLNYIFVLRKPSDWVTSVINHDQVVKSLGRHYSWGNEIFWKRHAGVDLLNFFNVEEGEKAKIIEKLLNFYFTNTKKSEELKNIKYTWIANLQEFVHEIGQFINEKPKSENSKRNKARLNLYKYINEEIDLEYEKLIADIVNRS